MKVDREVLEALAPRDGLVDHEYGFCMMCGNSSTKGNAHGYSGTQRLTKVHTPDCAWVRARAALDDNLEQGA